MTVRAVDGGGAGFRRADIAGTTILASKTTEGPLKSLDQLLDFVTENLSDEIRGIAYAMAGVIEYKNLVVQSPNVHFLDGIYLAAATIAACRRTIGKTISTGVFNDMEAAVTGMATLLSDEPYFMGITWSSGIGLRIWHKGELLSVAEGGHMVLDPSPFAPLCGCGRRGHAEAIVGGKAISRRVIAETQALGIELPPGEPCMFLDMAYNNDRVWAVNLYRWIARGMGIFLANIQTLLHLPLIVWKGTFAKKAFELPDLELRIRTEMKQVMIDPTWAKEDNLRFMFSPDPTHDSLIGAAACLKKQLQRAG